VELAGTKGRLGIASVLKVREFPVFACMLVRNGQVCRAPERRGGQGGGGLYPSSQGALCHVEKLLHSNLDVLVEEDVIIQASLLNAATLIMVTIAQITGLRSLPLKSYSTQRFPNP